MYHCVRDTYSENAFPHFATSERKIIQQKANRKKKSAKNVLSTQSAPKRNNMFRFGFTFVRLLCEGHSTNLIYNPGGAASTYYIILLYSAYNVIRGVTEVGSW